jgi:hypothetical protein
MQFSYQLVDRLDIVEVSIIYSVSIFVFVLLVGLLMVLTARFCVQQVIKQNQDYWKRMAIEMSNIVRQAQRIKETGGNLPPSQAPPPHRPDYRFTPPAPGYDQRPRSMHPDPYGPPPPHRDDPYGRPPPPRNNYNLY